MSRRVTTRTEIKDKDLAKDALKIAGFSYRDEGNTLLITSGKLANARIDLTTGTVSGDSDYRHSEEAMGELRRHYGEAKYTLECRRQGITIESRTVNRAGEVELVCMTA
jgi:hypothetical protein